MRFVAQFTHRICGTTGSILHLQVARAALKSFRGYLASPVKARLSPSSAYLSTILPDAPELPIAPPTSWLDFALLTRVLDLRAATTVAHLARLMDDHGKKFAELSWESVAVSQAVVESFLASRMRDAIERDEGLLAHGAGPAEKEVFRKIVLFVSPLPRLSLPLSLCLSVSPFPR